MSEGLNWVSFLFSSTMVGDNGGRVYAGTQRWRDKIFVDTTTPRKVSDVEECA